MDLHQLDYILIFLFFFVFIKASGDLTCPSITSPRLSVTCESRWGNRRGWVPCGNPVPVGTIARYKCRQYYKPDGEEHEDNTFSECQKDGKWSTDILQCVPECGKLEGGVTPLVVNGQGIKYGTWPWHAGLYNLQAGNWTFWCGGSLVNEYAVITAAHCTWKVNTESLRVVLGKFHREFRVNEEVTQIKDVKQIIMQPTYQDLGGNYGSDVAILVLGSPVEFSPVVQPVCIDWDLKAIDNDLTEGNLGMVAGWGVNENDTFSDLLRMVQLPVVSDQKCIEEQPRDFKKYVTYTTFCAGYRNGTGVCNGDSGGGLVFPHPAEPNGTWLLQGIVSVSPRRRGTSFCDSTYYTVFTKVGIYTRWLKTVLQSIQPHHNRQKENENNVSL
ncbi:clotting factor C-like [Periplaneta americana]|uniref:clotting factor C-like n=1 Tax=Periplaneta americana TaxID=6978 RepID=UPI0037E96EF7